MGVVCKADAAVGRFNIIPGNNAALDREFAFNGNAIRRYRQNGSANFGLHSAGRNLDGGVARCNRHSVLIAGELHGAVAARCEIRNGNGIGQVELQFGVSFLAVHPVIERLLTENQQASIAFLDGPCNGDVFALREHDRDS